jgi:hypothetical protein
MAPVLSVPDLEALPARQSDAVSYVSDSDQSDAAGLTLQL